ncbi:MAG TPA: hypothetical protein PK129_18170, partial [Cellvibrionaceae bacterium]|nr:hypothetical protein [Cellvibrionaceae bacterium]
NPHLLRVNSATAPRLWHPAPLYRLNPFRRALLYLDFIPDEILPPPSMGSSCIHAVVRFFAKFACHTVAANVFQQAAKFN